MNFDMPQPAWAVILASLGVVIALAVLFHPVSAETSSSILGIASSLVSGALGAFAGYATTKRDNAP